MVQRRVLHKIKYLQKHLVGIIKNKMLNSDEHRMNFTRQYDFQKQCSSGDVHCDFVSKKKADGVDHPFPNKAIIHRRAPKKQVPLGLDDFEKMCISTQERSNFLPQKYHSDVIRNIRGSRKTSQRMPSGELEMDGEIYAKERILLEKLGKVEQTIRKSIQYDGGNTQTGDVFKSRFERQHSEESKQEKPQKSKISHFIDIEEADWHGNFTRSRNKENPRTGDQMRNTYEVQEARGEVINQKMKSVTLHAKEPIRGKTVGEKHYKMWEEVDEKHNEQNQPSLGNTTWMREKKYKKILHKSPNGSGDKQNIHQTSIPKPVHRTATETQRREERELSTESAPLLVSNSSQRSNDQQPADLTETFMVNDTLKFLPCKTCNRMFRSERLETHTRICSKLKRSRPVYNTSAYRKKGIK
ncbi:PREDICTED: uncharacterized protein LOC106923539 [Poecilia mexicana]|uniref:uncharacterized protein LOC106923539 n=1 Tax=Poecilia mexicana TaxID=48701 RepID=UPI00072ED36C|nr:PREDICTED: uncharacterized protein LOC106923539 [Poecilia mexicana]